VGKFVATYDSLPFSTRTSVLTSESPWFCVRCYSRNKQLLFSWTVQYKPVHVSNADNAAGVASYIIWEICMFQMVEMSLNLFLLLSA